MLKPGKLHRVDCEWCGLKMACNCFLDSGENHVPALCPRCQVTDLVNDMFFAGSSQDAPQSKPTSARLLRLVPRERP